MIAYGNFKKKYKIHPHNECGICSERSIIKKSARQKAKKEIEREINCLTNDTNR